MAYREMMLNWPTQTIQPDSNMNVQVSQSVVNENHYWKCIVVYIHKITEAQFGGTSGCFEIQFKSLMYPLQVKTANWRNFTVKFYNCKTLKVQLPLQPQQKTVASESSWSIHPSLLGHSSDQDSCQSRPSSFLALLNFNTTMEGCRKKGVMYRKNGLCCPKLPNTGLEAPVYLLLVKKDLPNLAKQKSRAVQSAK